MSVYFKKSIYDVKNIFLSFKKLEMPLVVHSEPRGQICFEVVLKLFNVTSYSFITLFTILDHYTKYTLEEKGLSNYHLNIRELSLSRDQVNEAISILYRTKNQFLKTIHSTSQVDDIMKQNVELISSMLLKFDRFVSDLIKFCNFIDLNYLVDIYKMDVYYFKFELVPELVEICHDLKNLNNDSVSVHCHNALLVCAKIKKIFYLNQSLVAQFHLNLIPMMKFITIRNSISVEFLTNNPELELLSVNKGMNKIDGFDYKIAITKTLERIYNDLGNLVFKIMNQVESSLDIFFQLSNFYEKELKNILKYIKLVNSDYNITNNLQKLIHYFTKAMRFLHKLTNEYLINFKEFRATRLVHKEIIIILKVIYLNCLNSKNLLEDFNPNNYQADIVYLRRFSNSIDSISIASLRLSELVVKV